MNAEKLKMALSLALLVVFMAMVATMWWLMLTWSGPVGAG